MGDCSSWCTKSDAESQLKFQEQRKEESKFTRLVKIRTIQEIWRTYLAQRKVKQLKASK